MNDRRDTSRAGAELRTFVRTEYAGDGAFVHDEIARAGRGTPAPSRARADRARAGIFARLRRALSAAVAESGGT